jgi:23S rRNA (cytidine2498-2'-O)-methyltransferase
MTAYLAPEGLVEQLSAELYDVRAVHGRLVIARGGLQATHWAQNIWLEPRMIEVRSIAEGARALRAIQRNWSMYSFQWHRRAALIQSQLPHVSARPLAFPSPLPKAPLGSWTLLAPDRILASARCTSPFANGEVCFSECKIGPPCRAYLKLWDIFTCLQAMPRPQERCLDAGASPGGWTWVLARLGAKVLAVDRSDLAPSIGHLPGVEFRRGNAFAVRPEHEGPFDWIFCDVACYPEKLVEWLCLWLDSGKCRNFVCTVKFQGRSHYSVIRDLDALPHTAFGHHFHNKHELTWVALKDCGR